MKDYRRKFTGIVIAVMLLVSLFTVGAWAADSSGNVHNNRMGTTQHDPHGDQDINGMDHSMGTMPQSSQSGHDMNSMPGMDMSGGAGSHVSHGASAHEHGTEPESDSNPWPVLYGFGGVNLAVILLAGILKFTGNGNGVK